MSDANLAALALARETSWGVLAAPALVLQRFTKESLEHEKMTVKSATIRDDRQTDEAVEVGVEAKGGYEFELHVGDEDQILESALYGTWTGNVLRNGVTRTSFLIEKRLATADFVSFSGMMVDTLTLNLNSRQIVTGAVAFLGKKGVSAGVSVDADATYGAAGSGVILSASANVGNIKVDGVAVSSIKGLTLTIANNARPNDVIGKKELDEVGLGEIGVTGKMDAYFRTRTLLDDFINHALRTLSFEVSREADGQVAGDHIGYRVTIPGLRFPKGMPTVTGKNTDIMIPLEFDAEARAPKAVGTYTLIGQPANNDTVVLNGKTYTFQTVLTNVNGNVFIGATASDSLDNLIAAVTLGSGSGVKYAASTTLHPTMTAAAGAGDTVTFTAKTGGVAGNALTTVETGGNSSFGAATLLGGEDSYTIKIERLLKA